MQKAKRDDFRLEEELRSAKAKYEESSDDVYRRMQDIKDAETDSIRDLTRFLDAELDYHERCAEELRRTRRSWTASASSPTADRGDYGGSVRRPSGRSRSNTAQSFGRTNSHTYDEYDEPDELPTQSMRVPIRSQSRISMNSSASNQELAPAPRPGVSRSNTYQSERSLGASLSRTTSATSTPLNSAPPPQNFHSLRGQLRPTGRTSAMDVFADHDDDNTSSDTPPRSASPATSYGSSNRGAYGANGAISGKKAPPPPPSRAKKPPPPVPVRREVGY